MMKTLLTREGRIFLADNKKDFHSEFGFVAKKSMAATGKTVKTNKGKELAVLNPSFIDLYRKIRRHAQIITPKDVGLIITNTGINKKSFVVDLGSGSGALACFIASLAKKVVTYDVDDRSIDAVKENIRLLNIKNMAIKKKDCYEAIDEGNVDVITADLPEPWRALENARKSLKEGGFFASYSPHIIQSQRLVEEAAKNGFIVLKTVELIEREWVLDINKARPDFKGLGHTGFLTFLRKFD
ncbi:MAG TPA: 50S ribosomal protein L11 methyltransferase [Candidatus Nanoarchaeia archaeon]|nr:50S ribosomal protein L11 methyltransferase [Candidatus Nanoarchaeia archaeon]